MKQKTLALIAAFGAAVSASVAGDLTVEGGLNVTSNLTARALLATDAAVDTLTVSGAAVFAGPILGDGSGLTNLPAGVPFWPPNPPNAGDFTYVADGAGGITITGCSAQGPGEVVIPGHINGLAVTEIGDSAFFGAGMTSVLGGVNVRTVRDNAFRYCSSLESVSLPSAERIEGGAFYYCSSLTSVILPSAGWVGYAAFYGCTSLPSVSLPSAREISANVFGCCYSLSSVSMPSVMSVDWGSFLACSSLESVSLPSLTRLSSYEFEGCSSLASVHLPNVESIGDHAFMYCGSLASVHLPRLVSLGGNSFLYCSSLGSVSLPSVALIGGGSFAGCPALSSVVFSGDAPALGGALYSQTPNAVNYVASPTATGWGSSFGGRPVVRMPLHGDGSRLTGVTAAQAGAYTSGQTDAAIAAALAGFEPGAGVGTNHVGDVAVSGAVSALAFAGDGSSVTNLDLAAYAGGNLTWAGGQLHAAAAGAGYTDAQAVAAVTAADLDMNGNRITGIADAAAGTDAVNRRTVTSLVQEAVQQALLDAGPFGNLSMGAFTERQ